MADQGLTRLVVFSDDWGRHPSSCQHLIGQLLDRYPTLWVNTIGTRFPKPTLDDLRKVIVKLKQWSASSKSDAKLPANLSIVTTHVPGLSHRLAAQTECEVDRGQGE